MITQSFCLFPQHSDWQLPVEMEPELEAITVLFLLLQTECLIDSLEMQPEGFICLYLLFIVFPTFFLVLLTQLFSFTIGFPSLALTYLLSFAIELIIFSMHTFSSQLLCLHYLLNSKFASSLLLSLLLLSLLLLLLLLGLELEL